METAMTKTANKTKAPAATLTKAAGRNKPNNLSLAKQLSDQQLVAMAAACQRADRTIAIPETLEDEAISIFAIELITLGLAEEAPAGRGQPVWRQDEGSGQPVSLRITDQALAVLGIDESDEAKGAEYVECTESVGQPPAANRTPSAEPSAAVRTTTAAKAPKANTAPATANAATDGTSTQPRRTEPPQPRAGSKQGQLIAMLARDDGASITELASALSWLPHTTRAALTGLRHKGYELGREITDKRGSVYRITAMPIAAPASGSASLAEAA
jgi:hypothetical protein